MWTCRSSWSRHTWTLGQAYLCSSLARDRLKQIRLQVSNDLTQIPALEFTSCVAVGKSLHLSEPWFLICGRGVITADSLGCSED